MFGANSGGNLLFNGVNTSTPTSTPAPANNAFTLKQKPNGNVFGNIASNQENISSPSPAGAIVDNTKPTNTGGLFGQTASSGSNLNSGNLFSFANNTNTTTTNNNAATGTNSGGLFGNSTNTTSTIAPNNNTTNLFGGNTTTAQSTNTNFFGNKNTSTQPFTNMFGNKTNSMQNSTGLFGSSNNENSSSSGLFGNNSSSTGGLFGNKTTESQNPSNLLGNKLGFSLGSASQSQGNAAQSQQMSQPSLSSNPYGLQLNSVPVTTMPESITASMQVKKQKDLSLPMDKKRALSTSNVVTGPLVSNQSTLISKLSSRLNYINSREATHGLFSPSRKVLHQVTSEATNRVKDSKSSNSNISTLYQGKQFLGTLKHNDPSDMRKLKIDTNRSAAKKQRLLGGKSMTTKFKDMEELKSNTETSSTVAKLAKTERMQLEPSQKDVSESASPILSPSADEYWCSPTIEQLQQLPVKQLTAVPNFVIGRKGYGTISFDLDVDLSAFRDDFKRHLFGGVIIFNENKTVEVYPDDSMKPAIGLGLNVPSTISLERIYPVDKKTNKLFTDNSDFTKVQLFVKKLKSMRDMDFISYNPYDGIWTFKVKHFSIWGLINDSDTDGNDEAMDVTSPEEINQRIVAIPRRPGFSKKSESSVPGAFDAIVHIPSNVENQESACTQDELSVNRISLDTNIQENFDVMSDIIEEKPYEPSEVEEDDLEGLIVEPSLATAEDWSEQLKLAGDAYKSVFAPATTLTKVNNVSDILFHSFQSDMENYKSIVKIRKLDSNPNFVRFCNETSLLMKSNIKSAGWQRYILKSTLHTYKSSMDEVFKKSLTTALVGQRSNRYPIVMDWSLNFKDIAEAYSKVNEEYRVWNLASILFDPIEEEVTEESVKEVLSKKQRHQSLCSWIINEIGPEIESKLKDVSGLYKIFLYLVKRDIVGATAEAIATKNNHLAAMITMLGSNDPLVCDLAASQLNKWKSLGSKVDQNVVKIYQLLTGSPLDVIHCVNTADGFSWLATLGLHIFYGNVDSLSLEELISLGLDKISDVEQSANDDVISAILKLYCSKSDPESLIGQLRISRELLDVRLPWFFIQLLKRCDIAVELCDRITLQFVEQLKIDNMYQEALFVLCFLHDNKVAKQQFDHLVSSQVTLFSTETSQALLSRLQVPEDIYYEFLAVYNKYNKDHLSEATNLLRAKKFPDAEEVVIINVAPKLILNGSHEELVTLRELLKQFPSHEMDSWPKGLGVFEKYLENTLDGNDDQKLLEQLVHGLPILFDEYASYRDVSVLCCVISKRVCHIFLEKYKEALAAPVLIDRLLALPLGQPEKLYLRRSLPTH
ncbi:HER053Wp [Eremothecium sinecaudum]|uniref:HER053Wp n=1 Tax=Eremothecium sinecaudum TaxID=45286 RepID=A0A109UXG4_9SACH|nr:HER053Wp [Eremothecium sinecaudum]AMD21332.1 HER053Wp [Eremothecium sinecaudum]